MKKRGTISLDIELKEKLRIKAKSYGLTMSGFIAMIVNTDALFAPDKTNTDENINSEDIKTIDNAKNAETVAASDNGIDGILGQLVSADEKKAEKDAEEANKRLEAIKSKRK